MGSPDRGDTTAQKNLVFHAEMLRKKITNLAVLLFKPVEGTGAGYVAHQIIYVAWTLARISAFIFFLLLTLVIYCLVSSSEGDDEPVTVNGTGHCGYLASPPPPQAIAPPPAAQTQANLWTVNAPPAAPATFVPPASPLAAVAPPTPLARAPPSDWSADGSATTGRRRKSVSRPRERTSVAGWDPNSIQRRQSCDYRPDEDAHLDPGEFSGLVSLDDLRPALPELVAPSPSINAIEATQHRRNSLRAPNAYDQQQAAARRQSEIAQAHQHQAIMAQQT